MKKIIYGLVIIGLLWGSMTSCNKEGTVPENGFRAKIVQPGKGYAKGERTHINPNWTTQTETSVFWTENDLIKVANQGGNGSTLTFQLTEGENTTNGTFYTGEQNDGFFVPDYVAIYPVANAKGVANTISGTTATFNIPSTQIFKEKSFGEGTMPMVANSSRQRLDFYNVFGGICIPLTGGFSIDSIRLTSLDPNDKLWGVFTADCASTNPMPTHVSGGSNSVTLNCNKVSVNVNTSDFYFMVPPGTLESGFTITVYSGTTVIYEETSDWTDNPVNGFIPRSVIKKVDHKLEMIEVTTKSPTFISYSSAYNGGTASGAPATGYGILYALADDLSVRTSYEEFMEDAKANLIVDNNNVGKIDNNFTSSSSWRDFNTEAMTGLLPDRVYVVRAYATNSDGTVFYGEPIPFATRKDYANDYGGMIPSRFSVSPTKQINFSMGNLQWSATGGGSAPTTHAVAGGGTAAGTWRFAEYQFEQVGYGNKGLVYTGGMFPSGNVGMKCDNKLIGENYAGWIDLFGWATSGYHDPSDTYNLHYNPWSTSTTDYSNGSQNHPNAYGYGPSKVNNTYYPSLVGAYANYDWGVYNAISNGGNTPGRWRTIRAEWLGRINGQDVYESEYQYLMFERSASTVNGVPNARCAGIRINVRNNVEFIALLLFPDAFTWPSTYLNCYPVVFNEGANYNNSNGNIAWTEAQWSLLEKQGAVILPATYSRSGTNVYPSANGLYWTTGPQTASAIRLNLIANFDYSTLQLLNSSVKRSGYAVRLVRDAN